MRTLPPTTSISDRDRPQFPHRPPPVRPSPAMALQRLQDNPRSHLQPSDILTLQRTIGNRAVQRMLQQKGAEGVSCRPSVTPPPRHAPLLPTPTRGPRLQRDVETDTDYKNATALLDLTLKRLNSYAEDQADWHSSPTLTPAERTLIRNLLSFAREEDPQILAACGSMKAKDVADKCFQEGAPRPRVRYLRSYSKAASSAAQPFRLSPTRDVDQALKWGEDIEDLQSDIPDYVLKGAMPQSAFKELSRLGKVDDLTTYYTECNPILQAANGSDIISFLEMRVTDNVDPVAAYKGKIPQIRNFHRFHREVLTKLEANWKDKSKSKPLTLILHSALDHNGAFHRDRGLKQVFERVDIHALMIEGKSTLSEVTSELPGIAATYGMNGKIDQVMFAGHGNARSIQLAGDIANDNGTLKETNRSLNLDTSEEEVNTLFDTLLDTMDKAPDAFWKKSRRAQEAALQPHRRVVFNACLTNSNHVPFKQVLVEGNPKKARKQVRQYIKGHASLATHFQNRATAKKSAVTGVGANASIKEVGLIDNATGSLDIVAKKEVLRTLLGLDEAKATAKEDPYVTASKLEYVEHGKEPLGALRAVLEAWAAESSSESAACKAAMERRVAKGVSTEWDEAIIRACYHLILSEYGVNNHKVMRLLESLASSMAHIKGESHATVSGLKNAGWLMSSAKDIVIHILSRLTATDAWAASHHIPLIAYQVWCKHDSNKESHLFKHLGDHFTCASASRFLDMAHLDEIQVLDSLTTRSNKGQLLLALIGVDTNVAMEDCKYLLDQCTDPRDTGRRFAAGAIQTTISELLHGYATERRILQRMGRLGGLEDDDDDEELDANVHVVGGAGGKNSVYVESITKRGKIRAEGGARVHTGPDDRTAELAGSPLAKDTEVYIFGKRGNWYGIEYTPTDTRALGSGFIKQADTLLL